MSDITHDAGSESTNVDDITHEAGSESTNVDDIIVECPHCFGSVLIMKSDIRCGIFRHGIYKKNGRQINPHSSQKQCDTLLKSGKIVGCGKQFRLAYQHEHYCTHVYDEQ